MSTNRTLCITVRGRLSDHLAARFDGMHATRRDHTTELVGRLVDQAQLHGLLTRVRDLGLELESVRVLDPDPATSRSASTPTRFPAITSIREEPS